MKVLIIGGNRFVGLRLSTALDRESGIELHVLNRTGQVPHTHRAVIFKGDRRDLTLARIDQEYDVVVDFATFNDTDARASTGFFKRVGRYIFISTIAVYDLGADLREEQFDPGKFDLTVNHGPPSSLSYQLGKRRAEAEFAQNARFPVVSVRFPYILGPDDYTRRLEFHVERITRNQMLYLPDPSARVSMIHSEDACRFLRWSMDKNFTGPINVASSAPIRMSDFLSEIEKRVGRRALLAQQPSPQITSPYATKSDYFMDCQKVEKVGFTAKPISDWLGSLIDGAITDAPSTKLH